MPDQPPPVFNAKDEIIKAGDAWEQEVNGLLLHLDVHRVLYYPACLLDWNPIRWFSSICDVFICCDWMNRHDVVRDAIAQAHIPGFEKAGLDYLPEIVAEVINGITDMQNLPWDIVDRDEANKKPWGELVKLRRSNGVGDGDVWLLYFSGNPVKAYQNLFTAQQTAPRFVCLKHSVLFPVELWNTFASPNGLLMSAIRANPHLPLYMLRDISEPPAI